MQTVAKTKCGGAHVENEDHHVTVTYRDATILVVADGIGSHPFGGSVARWFCKQLSNYQSDFDAFENEVKKLHSRLLEEFLDFADMLESGASVSCVCISGDTARFLWAGDSPIWFCAPTREQSIQISSPHVGANGSLTQYFMGRHSFSPSTATQGLMDGDLIVVASDGANITLPDILDLQRSDNLEGSIASIVDAAVQSEGSDDATLVAYRHFSGS